MKQAGRLPEATYPGPWWVETGRTLFHTKGTECARPGDHSEKDPVLWRWGSPAGEEEGWPAGPVGVPLWRPPLVFFAFGFARVTQAATLKVLAPPSLSSGGPMARCLPCFVHLHRALLQGQGKSQPWRGGRERKGRQPRPTCGPCSPLLILHSPRPALDSQFPKPGSWTGTCVQPSGNPSALSSQEPQSHTHLDLQTTPHSTTQARLRPPIHPAATGQRCPSATSLWNPRYYQQQVHRTVSEIPPSPHTHTTA